MGCLRAEPMPKLRRIADCEFVSVTHHFQIPPFMESSLSCIGRHCQAHKTKFCLFFLFFFAFASNMTARCVIAGIWINKCLTAELHYRSLAPTCGRGQRRRGFAERESNQRRSAEVPSVCCLAVLIRRDVRVFCEQSERGNSPETEAEVHSNPLVVLCRRGIKPDTQKVIKCKWAVTKKTRFESFVCESLG